LIADNEITCGYVNSAGIRLHSNSAAAPITRAVVVNNNVTMQSSGNFGSESAGIELRRACTNTCVIDNVISGGARAALALIAEPGLIPGLNTLVLEWRVDFDASVAYLFIGADPAGIGTSKTIVVREPSSIEDHGSGTVIIPRP